MVRGAGSRTDGLESLLRFRALKEVYSDRVSDRSPV